MTIEQSLSEALAHIVALETGAKSADTPYTPSRVAAVRELDAIRARAPKPAAAPLPAPVPIAARLSALRARNRDAFPPAAASAPVLTGRERFTAACEASLARSKA